MAFKKKGGFVKKGRDISVCKAMCIELITRTRKRKEKEKEIELMRLKEKELQEAILGYVESQPGQKFSHKGAVIFEKSRRMYKFSEAVKKMQNDIEERNIVLTAKMAREVESGVS